MEEFNGFLPVYTSRKFDPRWFCVWEIFVLLSWGLQGDIWVLDSQSLFVLIIQQNLEVLLQIDNRLSLFKTILSVNNKNMKKTPKLVYFWLLCAYCGGWGWGSVPPAWKLFLLWIMLTRGQSGEAHESFAWEYLCTPCLRKSHSAFGCFPLAEHLFTSGSFSHPALSPGPSCFFKRIRTYNPQQPLPPPCFKPL